MQNTKNPNNKPFLMIIAIVVAVCICAAAVIAVIHTIRNDNPTEPTETTVDTEALAQQARSTVAMTLGEHSINAVELNYFYMEMVNSFLNEYYYYIYYYGMIDTSKPLNEQYFDETEGVTWSDYFLDVAKENIKSTYLLCQLAQEQGYSLSEAELANLDELKASIEYYAEYYQYADCDSYIADVFGYGADLNSYLAYYERAMLADSYYSWYAETLEYTDEQLREFEKDSPHTYNSYSFAYYLLDPSKFLTGGTEGSDGKITYTDEQNAAAIAAAEEAANALLGSECGDLKAFNDLIAGMDVHAGLDSVAVTEKTDVFYASIDSLFQEWLIDAERQHGDMTVIAKTTTSGEGDEKTETVTGYYIVWFNSVNENKTVLKNVRHLLVMFKDADGKTYSDGISSFTDEQKAAAKAEAEALLEQWQSGEATEDTFAALVNEKSEDPGSNTNGGLYENIYPGQMVENFEAWCFEEGRFHGNTGLVESPYGYHIMFFVGDSDMTYRDYMISYDLRSQDLQEWHDELVASVELVEVCLDFCELDMTLSG